MKGVSGSLLSHDTLQETARTGTHLASAVSRVVRTALGTLGPASAARQVHDRLAAPLFEALGHALLPAAGANDVIAASLARQDAMLLVGGWNADLRRLREQSLHAKRRSIPRWWIAINGAELRLVDGLLAFARRHTTFDLDLAVDDPSAIAALCALLGNGDVAASLDAAVRASQAHRTNVARSLQAGVETALVRLVEVFTGPRRRDDLALDAAFSDALTLVYRILFLLFAEARAAVPQWHPVYRRSYTIEALRPLVEEGHRVAGLWAAVQAISRLAHRGCRAGTLRVTAFNGRLFAPAGAPLAERLAIDDRVFREVLLAITTRAAGDRRARISYADLGVEQLGAVYERVLEFTPRPAETGVALAASGRRKATGTFYTPRAMTEYLVRRTLAPLVLDRSPGRILDLRILDPAMGSGAFLVAACRYLAEAYERALVAEGGVSHADVTAADRAGFRRLVAQRCLYGVDRNPMAVQLARLSLWLCTLAADKPLNFFDHHLRTGNSLVGADPADIRRQPPAGARRGGGPNLPLFGDDDLDAPLAATVDLRLALAREPDDLVEVVRRKERAVSVLDGGGAPLARWRAIADAWCAAWFWPAGEPRPSPAAWGSFTDALAGRASSLPPGIDARWREIVRKATDAHRFFHWQFEFPEVFFTEDGAPRPDPGFDAVIGNPPWETLRADAGTDAERSRARAPAHALARFGRASGCYRWQGGGHANLYQLFAERMLRLARPAGRVGLLMPWGLLADHGSRPLREALLQAWRIDLVIGFENRAAIFPIHRSTRFALVTATSGGATAEIPARMGLQSAAALDDVPDTGPVPGSVSVPLTLIRRFSGDDLAVPELKTEADRALVARIAALAPPLGSAGGWHARFGRELNASDDRPNFGRSGLPVIEGKHLDPFRVTIPADVPRIHPATAARVLGSSPFARPRLGYREVASATNRLTLIAAMIPAGTITTHTIFCLKDQLPEDVQWFLCGVCNSFVANYLVRIRGGTHVPAATLHQLPVPRLAPDDPRFTRVAALARYLGGGPVDGAAAGAELQAIVSGIYGMSVPELHHVLDTFPLIETHVRTAAAAAFSARRDAI